MTAYAIFIREEPAFDEAEMAEYIRKNRENPKDPNLTPLAVYGALDVLEGKAPDGVIVLSFPTMADARAWYDSPAYQDAAQHRMRGANYRAFVVEGF